LRSALLLGVFLVMPGALVSQEHAGLWPWETDASWRTVLDHLNADDSGLPLDALRVARAELNLGRVRAAATILEGITLRDSSHAAPLLALQASVASAEGRHDEAGRLFAHAATLVSGRYRGILAARAGSAYHRAGDETGAAGQYGVAMADLPRLAGWLGVRLAGVIGNDVAAESLLVGAPEAAAMLVLETHALRSLRSGDSAAAIGALARAGKHLEAARMGLAISDSVLARREAYAALVDRDTTDTRASLDLVLEVFSPANAAEFGTVARSAARVGEVRHAARYGGEAVAVGDSSSEALVAWGGWLELAGRRREALDVYARAGPDGAFARARALLRLGQRGPARQALVEFATKHPDHRAAPLALFLASDAGGSDTLLHTLAQQWPSSAIASSARMRLAARSLTRHDTLAARDYYGDEVRHDGSDAPRASYLLARLEFGSGDSQVARTSLVALARDDSIGYYGTIAREEAGLPPLVIAPPPDRAPTAAVWRALEDLDDLDAAGMVREADMLVVHLVSRSWSGAHEILDLAEGLIARDRVPQGIRLGWQAARSLSLNHPRVIRVVFPWPERELIETEAEAFGLDPYLLAGLIRQESSFKSSIRSRAGAVGFMQLMPATAREVANRLGVPWSDLMRSVPDANVHIGSAHLAGLLRGFDGAVIPALAAYNAGGTPVRRWLRYPEASDPVLFVERIPYTETRGYVKTVLRNRPLYRALYPPHEPTP